MTALSVNVNKIALIRNSREGGFPSVIHYAKACLAHGVDGITAHPRPDQRHITAQDCHTIHQAISAEFNMEGNPFAAAQGSSHPDIGDYPGFMPLVEAIRPAQCTLVPDSTAQLTSDHGFNLHQTASQLAPVIEQLHALGIRSSLFMDADVTQIQLAADLGVQRIELYTGPYAARFRQDRQAAVRPYTIAAEAALKAGLQVNAGHDLNLHNLGWFMARVPGISEVSIGHAFTVDCLYHGLPDTVRQYRQALVH